ncbi:MAG: DUF2083 domain-containing protein, partial [Caulobacteraceae bacterium]|nr:DUF2083 domain-containing protein [Caulobacteraceae bacterium]
LAETYDLNLRSLSAEADDAGAAGLAEVFADPLLSDLGVSRRDLAEAVENAPGVAEGIVRLYRAYLGRRGADRPDAAASPAEAWPAPVRTPSDWVRDFIQGHRNHFPELEAKGEALAGAINAQPYDFAFGARERLAERHKIEVRVMPAEVLGDQLRRYDHHRKRLFLSEALTGAGRAFALAYQLAQSEHGGAIRAAADLGEAPDAPTRNLLRVSLANYLAAAILMPYAPFFEAVEANGYDLDLVRARFGVSYEQACHRLTTLARPTARGVPFFMLRVDQAGNISKRYASAAFPFSRFGGACPRWNIHTCFRTPGRIVTQVIETPDGDRFFTLSRTVRRSALAHGADEGEMAVGLGCELKYAARLVYSRGTDLAEPASTPVGPACRLCERPACPQRAAEPANRTLKIDDFSKSVSPYPFS